MERSVRKEKRERKPQPLNRQILLFIMVCWLIPIVIFSTFFIYSFQNSHVEKTEALIKSGIKNSAELITTRINKAITDVQQPSYEKVWEEWYLAYKQNGGLLHEFYQNMNGSLRERYYHNSEYMSYAFYLEGQEEALCYGSKNLSYSQKYLGEVEPYLRPHIEEDNNYAKVLVIDNHIFIIRNLYTISNYEKFGSLIVELNIEAVLENASLSFPAEILLIFDDSTESLRVENGLEETGENTESIREALVGKYKEGFDNEIHKISKNAFSGYLYQKKEDHYTVGIGYVVDYFYLMQNYEQLLLVVLILLAVFVPLLAVAILYMKKQIMDPVQKLIDVFREIQEGKIGTTCQGYKMPNREFADLIYAFNNMSLQVKFLFDTVYNEKLERKDAQIAALQSQINPHFLNNTLEMMNWQARMNQDIEVSKMIEALGILLDYRTNRENNISHYLSEEIRSADAYMYIISMRFGQRLSVEKNVDESLLRVEVPKLILQPILENAVTHGIEKVKSGEIRFHIYKKEDLMYMDVINSGKEMTKEAQERIDEILNGKDKIQKKKGQHVSIGIRNVNRRIKLLYGEEYGLSISKLDESHVLSRMIIPLHGMEREKMQDMMSKGAGTREEELEQILQVLNRSM